MTKPKAYLAGPDVFLPEPQAQFDRKKALCARHGFEGVSPLDSAVAAADRPPLEVALEISRKNEAAMDRCDLLVANMTPFRGASLDAGTAYEIGYMRGRGKPVFGYSNDPRSYVERVTKQVEKTRGEGRSGVHPRPGSDRLEDNHQMEVESYGLLDNLMLEGALRANDSEIRTPAAAPPEEETFTDTAAFEAALADAEAAMAARQAAGLDEAERAALLEEWSRCRSSLESFDKLLIDLRKFGFSLVTVLVSASGFLYLQTGIGAAGIGGVYVALLVLIVGLFRQDRVVEVFIRSTVLRALAIEQTLKLDLSFVIAYWSGKSGTGTWGLLLYLLFCVTNVILALAGLFNADIEKQLPFAEMLGGHLPSVALFAGTFLVAILWIVREHRGAYALAERFKQTVNARARALDWNP